MKPKNSIYQQILRSVNDTFLVWRKEIGRVVRDPGVLIFFILVPVLYPLLYAFIYTGEVVREVPVVAVDLSHTASSRDFFRSLDASPDVHIVAYAAHMEEARLIMKKQQAYGTVLIPEDFSTLIHSGKQARVAIYCDMSGLLYYKAILSSCTDVSLDKNRKLQVERLGNTTNRQDAVSTEPLRYEYVPMFNPQNGFASFLIPAVLILIIQQTLLLGIGQINGTARERHLFHLQMIGGGRLDTLLLVSGKALCYLMVYMVMTTWLVFAVPRIFHLPQIPQLWDLLAFMLPYVLACIFFAMTLSLLVRSRETCMPLFVFTSVPLLFISGISWPGASISVFWKTLSWIFPSTFGINGFVRLNSMGALLQDVRTEYGALWIQTGIYFMTACLAYNYMIRESKNRNSQEDETI